VKPGAACQRELSCSVEGTWSSGETMAIMAGAWVLYAAFICEMAKTLLEERLR